MPDPQARDVWITLDDGPQPTQTAKVLNALGQFGITAVFFLSGEKAKAHPAIMHAIHDAGHRIGNHAYSHRKLTTMTELEIRDEIQQTKDLIAGFEGLDPLFRPPYGARNALVDRVSDYLGYRTVIWNVDTRDWDAAFQPTGWMDRGVSQIRAQSSSIVLAHDIQPTTADNFATFLQKVADLGGVTFRPASEI